MLGASSEDARRERAADPLCWLLSLRGVLESAPRVTSLSGLDHVEIAARVVEDIVFGLDRLIAREQLEKAAVK